MNQKKTLNKKMIDGVEVNYSKATENILQRDARNLRISREELIRRLLREYKKISGSII